MNRLHALGVLPTVIALALPAPSAAQTARPNQLTIDLEVVGASFGYARSQGDGRYLGFELGGGGSFLDRMLLAGRHFSEPNGPSYETRDGATDETLFEIAHVALFHRWAGERGWRVDAGVRGSVFLHEDSSDDDPAFPSFLGAYGSFLWGGTRFAFGPRLLVGWFSEGSGANELGIYLVPLTGRVTFGW